MHCSLISCLLCLFLISSPLAQSSLLPSDSHGTLVTCGPNWAFGDNGSVSGLGFEVSYSPNGRIDAGARYRPVGGPTPTRHNCHVITPFLGYALIKQNRESADPISFSALLEFDILIPDAGVFSYERAEDPDGNFRFGLALSRNLSSWAKPVAPCLTILYSKPVGYNDESKMAFRFELDMVFDTSGDVGIAICPQVEKFGDVGSASLRFGLMFR